MELLVFEHTDEDPAGVRVPAGSMQPLESLTDAAARAVYEETGLTGLTYVDQVGYVERGLDEVGGPAVVNFVHLAAQPGPGSAATDARAGAAGGPAWEHTVTGDGADAGLVFRCRWEPLPLQVLLAADQGAFLESFGKL
jgi:ADP-ribose pyrophosphatase YjhB (NUDIX family)